MNLKGAFTSKKIALTGIIASLYAILTICLPSLSYGQLQIRIAEALTILPLFYGEAVIGLTVGCLIANIFGNGLLDVLFGTLATFVASLITYLIGKKIKSEILQFVFGALPPVLINAFVVPLVFFLSVGLKEGYLICVLQILIGQTLAVYLLGFIVYKIFKKIKKNIL